MTKKCPFSFNNPNYQEGMECIGEQCAFWVPYRQSVIRNPSGGDPMVFEYEGHCSKGD